jgi:hypothetical protein
MASTVYMPKMKFWAPVTGVPAASYNVRFYAAGTTTNQSVFTDAACTIPAANPVQLDSNGEALCYAVPGTLYKIALYDVTNTVLQAGYPCDNISIYGSGSGGGGGGGGGSSVAEWVSSGFTPAFISSTSFAFPIGAGNLTSVYTFGRVLQTTNTSGTVYSVVTASTFSGGFTTITVAPYFPGGTGLDSGLSVVNFGVLNAANPSSPEKSLLGVIYGHNTETLASGVSQTLNTVNGFAASGGGLPSGLTNLGEFSGATGLFTAARTGIYQVNTSCLIGNTGTTFTGNSSLSLVTTGTVSAGFLSPRFASLIAGYSFVAASGSGIIYMLAGATVGLSIVTNFTGSAPVFNTAEFNLFGPL